MNGPDSSAPASFLRFADLGAQRARSILADAARAKKAGVGAALLSGKVMAILFEKPSTRTRVSLEAGMAQLGGHPFFLSAKDTQLSRGEPVSDTARVISSMCDIIAIRAADHDSVAQFAAHSLVPVINALTDLEHPCQILADILTFEEMRGTIRGARLAWVGDHFNVSRSWMAAARMLDFELSMATPEKNRPDDAELGEFQKNVSWSTDPQKAVAGADCVMTDVWMSMGWQGDANSMRAAFSGFTVDAALMAGAGADAGFMHCLPARRGEEVAGEVIDGPASWVWLQAENRMHAQKALILNLLGVVG